MVQTLTDTVRYRFILFNLVGKEFKVLYRTMALGFLWAVLQPLVMVTVLSIVWTVFFPQTKDNFASFVIVVLIPFNFLHYCLSGCTGSIQRNAGLVKKVRFPRQLLPFSIVTTHAIHFAIQAPLIIFALILFPPDGDVLGWNLLWLPLVVVVHLGLALGLGLLVSGLNVVYRDVQYVVDSLLVIMFWITPVLYDARKELGGWPDWLTYIYYANPISGVLEAYRNVLFFGKAPDSLTFSVATLGTLILGAWGVKSFWVHEKQFADLI